MKLSTTHKATAAAAAALALLAVPALRIAFRSPDGEAPAAPGADAPASERAPAPSSASGPDPFRGATFPDTLRPELAHGARGTQLNDTVSSAPEELVTLLEHVDDPDLMVLILKVANVAALSDEQKLAIMRRAYSIDPYQRYVREMAVDASHGEVASLLLQNGASIYRGEMEGVPVTVSVDSPVSPRSVKVMRGEELLTAPFLERTDRGGLLFLLPGEGPRSSVEVELRASSRGLLLDITLPGWSPYRLEVWDGAEVPERDIPLPITDQIEQLLFPSGRE